MAARRVPVLELIALVISAVALIAVAFPDVVDFLKARERTVTVAALEYMRSEITKNYARAVLEAEKEGHGGARWPTYEEVAATSGNTIFIQLGTVPLDPVRRTRRVVKAEDDGGGWVYDESTGEIWHNGRYSGL